RSSTAHTQARSHRPVVGPWYTASQLDPAIAPPLLLPPSTNASITTRLRTVHGVTTTRNAPTPAASARPTAARPWQRTAHAAGTTRSGMSTTPSLRVRYATPSTAPRTA